MEEFRKRRLIEFAAWVGQNITGDEKGEAQIFLDHLFRAFGREGCREVGGHLEFRVRKGKKDGGGIAFADYVWKPVVLIEMKKRGTDLAQHYRQAFDYWLRLVPGRPRYVVLSNFDQFWVYDFENQLDDPVDRVTVGELPERYGPLAFLFATNDRPVFGNDHVAVTRAAADRLAACFNKLIIRKVERGLAQRFTLQMLVALFAEDIGLLDRYVLPNLLADCQQPRDSYDLLGGLFEAMNTPGGVSGGRFRGVQYFNGGVFSEPARVELYKDELNQLQEAAKADWSKVRPEIFGTLFEHSMEQEERRAFGAHFTSPIDILKIVRPTLVEPWRQEIEAARSTKRLLALHDRMQHFTVLDPACGSGNFLYIAYREMKRLEALIFERVGQLSPKDARQRPFGFVTARNFFGLDINPFAVELAKVTMMIARKLAIDELHVTENALPLDNLDANFMAGDALIDAQGQPTAWPRVDAIIGNPPFVGAKRLKPERGSEYVNAVRRAYPDVPGMADYCVYWFRKAHDHLQPCTAADPLTGRAGLVGTQNVRNNQSRVGGLDHIVETGTILDAVDNQPWSGAANVHVSIVNWVKSQNAKIVPAKRRLWSKAATPPGEKKPRTRGTGPADKEFELVYRDCTIINSALSDETDVSKKRPLTCNKAPKRCFQGKIPGYDGFLIDANLLKRLWQNSRGVISPYVTGREILGGGHITRWAIDFRDGDMIQAASYASAFEHCKKHVLPAVREAYRIAMDKGTDMAEARKEHLDRWWQFWNRRDELNASLAKLSRYIGCSRVTRRPIMFFLSTVICPSDLVQVFALDDDYSFGILQSFSHFEWFRKSSRLKVESDVRYSVREIFDTFPWPQGPTRAQVDAVAEAGREVRRIRVEALAGLKGGLRALYRTVELPGRNPLKDAHAALDAAVLAAYGFAAKGDLLAELLDLNLEVARREAAGEPVTGPGVPPTYGEAGRLVSEDCIRAE